MSNKQTVFDTQRAGYSWRLMIASIFVALAAGSGHVLYAGLARDHFIMVLAVCCITASAAFILGVDLVQRRLQLLPLRVVEDRSKPYGITGTLPPRAAANDLGRKTRRQPGPSKPR